MIKQTETHRLAHAAIQEYLTSAPLSVSATPGELLSSLIDIAGLFIAAEIGKDQAVTQFERTKTTVCAMTQ